MSSPLPARTHNCRRAVSPRPSRLDLGCGTSFLEVPSSEIVHRAPLTLGGDAGPSSCRSLRKDNAEVERLVTRVRAGLELGVAPRLIPEGEGGTYVLFDAAKRAVAIFKPSDEEPPALNNPKKHAESPSRKGIIPGDGALRETAAYLLDRGWAGVPPTTMLEIRHPVFGPGCKVGSVQEWIHNSEAAGSFGPSLFSTADVHRIGILDVRTLNTDRHDGNILCTSSADGKLKLIPIDHGFVLPAEPGEAFFDWLNWPQTRQPFSADELEYIARIDIEADLKMLRKLGLSQQSQTTYRMATTVLKVAAAAGLTLHDIAELVCRPASDPERPSALEDLAEDARGCEPFWEEFEALTIDLVAARKAAASLPKMNDSRHSTPGSSGTNSSASSPSKPSAAAHQSLRAEARVMAPPAMHRSASVETIFAAV